MSVRSDATGGQYLSLGADLPYNAAYTRTGWFKCEDAATLRAVCDVFNDDVTYNYDCFDIGKTTSRHPNATVRIAGTATRQEGADSISDNTWYFWVLRRASVTSLELRIGTTSETTITTNVTGRAAVTDLSFFDVGGGESASPFKGSMAQCRIWTTNLTDGELVTEMNSPTAVKSASLWAEWRMVNLSGIATDSSGNSRNFSVVNGTFTTGADDPVQGVAVPYNRQPLFGPLLAQ